MRIFADHTRENKRKQNVPTIFVCRAVFHVFIFTLQYIASDESQLFWLLENLESFNLSHMPG